MASPDDPARADDDGRDDGLLDTQAADRRLAAPPHGQLGYETTVGDSLAPAAQPAPSTPLGDRMVGRRLGEFEIVDRVGAGGFGTVYRAEQRSLGRQAIIKIPNAQGGPNRQRFLREARVASMLDHPYAAHVYAFGEEPDGLLWIAMELVRGTPLDEYLRFQGPLPLVRAVPFIERLGEVTQRAHELGIVHRDLKPSNVMVIERSGRLLPKLLDFGIARAFSLAEVEPSPGSTTRTGALEDSFDAKLTQRGAIMGSPLYMAPEQWVDAGSVGPPADIYALGLLCFELLTGRAAFKGTTLMEIAKAHAGAAVPPLGAGFPAGLDAAIAKATAKQIPARYAKALDFVAALTSASELGMTGPPLPRISDDQRARILSTAPRPIAESVAALDGARTAHQAHAAFGEVVRATTGWLGVIALAARSRQGARGGDSAEARDLVRALRQRELSSVEWLVLAAAFAAPFRDRPELHTIPPLARWLGSEAAQTLAALADDSGAEVVGEERVRTELVTSIKRLDGVLASLEFLSDYPVVGLRDPSTSWMGTRGSGMRAPSLRGALAEHEVVLVDADGAPLLGLDPWVAIAAPIPGTAAEMFLLRGGASSGARLVASPSGFEHVDVTVFERLRTAIFEDADTPTQAVAPAERAPYRGLAAFTIDDAEYFFGRERETEVLVNRLRVQPLLAVVGQSGSGKSSLVQAGMIPALRGQWRAIVMRPGPAPLAALRAALTNAGIAVPPGSALALGELLATSAFEGSKLLLFVDQFEEVFTLCADPEERRVFATALASAVRSPTDPVRIVLTLRDDFLLAAEQLPALRERLGPGLVLVLPPTDQDLVRTITEPARRVDYRFDDAELPRRMVRDVADQPGGLALLSFAASALWERRDRHFHQLLRAEYDAMGGVTGALVGHAEALIAGMTDGEQRLLRELFRRLVTAEGTRAVSGRQELVEALGEGALSRSVLEKVIASRLIVASEGSEGEERIEVAHETLLRAWPRLVEWQREDREGARLRDQLRSAAKQWHDRGRADGLLWRDEALAEYRIWRKRFSGGLTEVERAFADASVAAERRLVRRRRFAIGVLITVAAAVAIVFFGLSRRAERAAAETRDRLIESHIENARIALAAGQRWDALRSVRALRGLGIDGPPYRVMQGIARESVRAMLFRLAANRGSTYAVAYSPDGKLLAAGGEDGAGVWDAETGALRGRLVGHDGAVQDVAFRFDGQRIATAGSDGTVRIWDRDGRPIARLFAGEQVNVRVVWRPDGKLIAAGGDAGHVVVWDAETHEQLMAHKLPSPAATVEFGRQLLAIGGWDGEVVVIDPAARRVVLETEHCPVVGSVDFDSLDARLVTTCNGPNARIMDVASGAILHELEGAYGNLVYTTFSADGREVIASSRDGTARVWNAAEGTLRLTLTGHQGTVWQAQFTPTGDRIVTVADDLSARLWDRTSGASLAVLEGHSQLVYRAAISPDGARLATASFDGSLVMWKLAPSHVEQVWYGFETEFCNPAPRAAELAVMACGSGTRVWDLRTRALLATLPKSTWAVAARDRAWAWLKDSPIVRSWSLPSGAELPALAMPAPVQSLAVSATGTVFVGDTTGGLREFDRQGHAVRAFPGHKGSITAIAALPGGGLLTAESTGSIRLFTPVGELASILDAPPRGYDLALSHDGKAAVLVGAESMDVVLIKLVPVPHIEKLQGHSATIVTARFEPGDRRLLTTSSDGTAIRWDLTRGELLQRYKNTPFLADVAIDASGKLVIAVDGRGRLVYFDAESGRRLASTDGTRNPGSRMWILPDAQSVATLDWTGGLSISRIPFDQSSIAELDRELACMAPNVRPTESCR